MQNGTNGRISIHGREYKTVALRVSEFREACPITEGWAILSEVVSIDDDKVVMRATVAKGGTPIAIGHAEEVRSASSINKTSALENCETSAIGRALAACGFAGSEYASADEVAQAISQQDEGEAVKHLRAHNDTLRAWFENVHVIKTCLSTQQWDKAAEAYAEIPEADLRALWVAPTKGGIFSTDERAALKSSDFAAALKNFKETKHDDS